MSESFRLRLLGEPVFLDPAGEEIRLRTRKQYAVLVYLVLEGLDRGVIRDRLASLVWPEVPLENARHSLSQAITEIRRRVGRPTFRRGSGPVRLVLPVVTDLEVGPDEPAPVAYAEPLRGAEDWAGSDFAIWVEQAREACRHRIADGWQSQIAILRKRGEVERIQAFAAALHAADPYSDTAVLSLAEREIAAGNSHRALLTLREHARRVQQDLSCPPGEPVRELIDQLKAGTARGPGTRQESLPGDQSATQVRMIGRERELAELEAAWALVQRGGHRLVLIAGPAGIGKSALLRRFGATMESRCRNIGLLMCQEIGRGIPFSTTHDLISSLLLREGASGTAPAALSELSRVMPSIRTRFPGVPEPPDIPGEITKLRVADALVQLVEAVAESEPQFLGVDDVQHLDPASRDILFHLLRRLRTPLMLVGSRRTEAPGLFDSSSDDLSWNIRLTPAPLSEAETHDLIAQADRHMDSRIAVKISELACGNPYHIELLLQDWHRHHAASLTAAELGHLHAASTWHPPQDLRLAFKRQLDASTTDALWVLRLLATARRSLTVHEVAQCVDHSVGVVHKVIRALLDDGLLAFSAGRVSFKNELHRAFTYYTMSPSTRAYLHGSIAATLGRSANTSASSNEIEIGRHLLESDAIEDGVRALQSGARSALNNGAFQEAEAAVALAMSAGPQSGQGPSLQDLLLEAVSAQGKYDDVLNILASTSASPDGEVAVRREVMRAEAMQRSHLRSDREILDAAVNALLHAGRQPASTDHLRALQVFAEVVAETADASRLSDLHAQASLLVDQTATPKERASALMTVGYCAFVLIKPAEALRHFTESVSTLRELEHEPNLARVFNGIGASHVLMGNAARSIAAFWDGLTLAEKVGDILHSTTLWCNTGVAFEYLGDFDAASICHGVAEHLLDTRSTPRKVIEIALNRADLALILGDLPRADQALTKAAAAVSDSRSRRLRAWYLMVSADFHLARGEPELAWPLVKESRNLCGGHGWMVDFSGRSERQEIQLGHILGVEVQSGVRPSRCVLQETEVIGAKEWTEGVTAALEDSRCYQMSRQHDLPGIFARLLAVGVIPSREISQLHSSPADTVQRVFPAPQAPAPSVAEVLDYARRFPVDR